MQGVTEEDCRIQTGSEPLSFISSPKSSAPPHLPILCRWFVLSCIVGFLLICIVIVALSVIVVLFVLPILLALLVLWPPTLAAVVVAVVLSAVC